MQGRSNCVHTTAKQRRSREKIQYVVAATRCSALPELIFVTTSNRDRSGGNWTKMLYKFSVYFEATLISYVPVHCTYTVYSLNVLINFVFYYLFYVCNKERVKEKYSYCTLIKSIFREHSTRKKETMSFLCPFFLRERSVFHNINKTFFITFIMVNTSLT